MRDLVKMILSQELDKSWNARVWEIGVLSVRELSENSPEQDCTASGSSRSKSSNQGLKIRDEIQARHKDKVQKHAVWVNQCQKQPAEQRVQIVLMAAISQSDTSLQSWETSSMQVTSAVQYLKKTTWMSIWIL